MGFFSGKRGGEAAPWCGFPQLTAAPFPLLQPISSGSAAGGLPQPLPARSTGAGAWQLLRTATAKAPTRASSEPHLQRGLCCGSLAPGHILTDFALCRRWMQPGGTRGAPLHMAALLPVAARCSSESSASKALPYQGLGQIPRSPSEFYSEELEGNAEKCASWGLRFSPHVASLCRASRPQPHRPWEDAFTITRAAQSCSPPLAPPLGSRAPLQTPAPALGMAREPVGRVPHCCAGAAWALGRFSEELCFNVAI